jgi:hypothetical protein
MLKGISFIEGLNFLHQELQGIKNLDFFYNYTGNDISFDSQVHGQVTTALTRLKNRVKEFITIFKSIINDESEFELHIKLIEHNSLGDLGDELKILDKVINQLITHKKINGTYKFSSFDLGTTWVYIVFSSAPALLIIASAVWSACVIRKKWLEGNLLLENIRQMKIKTESLKDIQETNEKLLRDLTENEAKNILSENDLDDPEHEYKERVIYAIKTLSDLIDKGAEIHPAIMAPEEVKNLFPDFSSLDLIESKTKLLEDKPT